MQRSSAALWVLIAGLAFVFIVFGIDKFVNPFIWISWIPAWMEGLAGLNRETWLSVIGAAEIVLGGMLLIPYRNVRRLGAIFILIHLLFVLTQTGWNDVAVRDIGLLASSVALFLLL